MIVDMFDWPEGKVNFVVISCERKISFWVAVEDCQHVFGTVRVIVTRDLVLEPYGATP